MLVPVADCQGHGTSCWRPTARETISCRNRLESQSLINFDQVLKVGFPSCPGCMMDFETDISFYVALWMHRKSLTVWCTCFMASISHVIDVYLWPTCCWGMFGGYRSWLPRLWILVQPEKRQLARTFGIRVWSSGSESYIESRIALGAWRTLKKFSYIYSAGTCDTKHVNKRYDSCLTKRLYFQIFDYLIFL